MNFFTRLFGLIFNKDRTTPATDRAEDRQAEGPDVEPEPEADITVFAAVGSQTNTRPPAPPAAPTSDTGGAESHSATVENIAGTEKERPGAPAADAGIPDEATATRFSADSVGVDPADAPTANTVEPTDAMAETGPTAPTDEAESSAAPDITRDTASPPDDTPKPAAILQPRVTREMETSAADIHDIDAMIRCCDMELKKKRSPKDLPAPLVFERVAILSRKEKNYSQEITYCERYIKMTEVFYKKHGTEGLTDVRKGARHRSIVERLPKARALLEKQRN